MAKAKIDVAFHPEALDDGAIIFFYFCNYSGLSHAKPQSTQRKAKPKIYSTADKRRQRPYFFRPNRPKKNPQLLIIVCNYV
jgi:hypothetical protein